MPASGSSRRYAPCRQEVDAGPGVRALKAERSGPSRPSRAGMKILVLGCKDYPAFVTPWVHSGGMEVYTERMVRSLTDRARFTLYTAGGHSDEAGRVVALGAARGLRSQPLSLMLRSWRAVRAVAREFDLLHPQTPPAGAAVRMAWRR